MSSDEDDDDAFVQATLAPGRRELESRLETSWRSERRTVGSARPAAEDGGDVPAYRGHVDGNVPPAHPTGLGYHVGPELGPHVV